MTKIQIYTSPTCGACNMLKKTIAGSELESMIEFKEVHGEENKANLEFLQSKGFSSIPLIHIFNDKTEDFHVGFAPIPVIKQKIKKVEEV